jgi:asparagine synthase (glutamine-hydrolysing)
MCGIAGIVGNDLGRSNIKAMADALHHRGPDDSGFYSDECVELAHLRLSVIDVDGGHQPMVGANGSIMIFNGEIYNYRELKEELLKQGEEFTTDSDTEVLLRLFEKEGEHCLKRLNGMFAFAVWEPRRKRLFLARDRLGKKPLYLFRQNGFLGFASEIKSLLALDLVHQTSEIDIRSLRDFLTFGYVLTPKTIFKNISTLPPAHWATFDFDTLEWKEQCYWDLATFFCGKRRTYDQSTREEFSNLLNDAVKLRLRSDVPLGTFLSGGLDSTAITMATVEASRSPPQAFCVEFDDINFDESQYAQAVADKLSVELERLDNPKNPNIEKLVWHFDQPFADTSIIPTYTLNQAARSRVTVVLSGDGGDEILAGYQTILADKIFSRFRFLPFSFRKWASRIANWLLKPTYRKVSLDYKIRRFLSAYHLNPKQAHVWWRGIFSEEEQSQILNLEDTKGYDPMKEALKYYEDVPGASFLDQCLYVDIKTWLLDDILVKIDRMSMAHGLEVRSPFLDHRLVEFSATLEAKGKISGRKQKKILRDVLTRKIPKNIINRKKQGFGAPTRHLGINKLETAGFDELIKNGFQLDPEFEDVTYKSFLLNILDVWLKIYLEYKKTGIWRPLNGK